MCECLENKSASEKLKDILLKNDKIVFFGGAGVSTASGIPDFRSVDGLYNQKYKFPPEVILSHTFFMNNTSEFYRFYKDKMLYLNSLPNGAHTALSKLEKKGKLLGIITQNIDGLHQKAGSKKVFELHGSVHRNYCMNCGKFYGVEVILNADKIPKCTCGGIIKPDVVLYEEGLDNKTLKASIEEISNADVLIIGGTSLNVYPAAGLIDYFSGKHLILINKSKTPYDKHADIVINDDISKVLAGVI